MTNELIVAIIFGTIATIFMALQLFFPKPMADYGNKRLSNKEKIMNKAGRIIYALLAYAFPIMTIGYVVAFRPLDKIFVVIITMGLITIQLAMQVQTQRQFLNVWKSIVDMISKVSEVYKIKKPE